MTHALGLASKDMQSHMEKYAKRNRPIHSPFITPPPPQHKHHPLQRIQVITECPSESTCYRIGCTYFRSNKVRIITKQMYEYNYEPHTSSGNIIMSTSSQLHEIQITANQQ